MLSFFLPRPSLSQEKKQGNHFATLTQSTATKYNDTRLLPQMMSIAEMFSLQPFTRAIRRYISEGERESSFPLCNRAALKIYQIISNLKGR